VGGALRRRAGLRVDLDLFGRPGASLARAIEERFEEMADLLGAVPLPG
jgi:hypothetical protein